MNLKIDLSNFIKNEKQFALLYIDFEVMRTVADVLEYILKTFQIGRNENKSYRPSGEAILLYEGKWYIHPNQSINIFTGLQTFIKLSNVSQQESDEGASQLFKEQFKENLCTFSEKNCSSQEPSMGFFSSQTETYAEETQQSLPTSSSDPRNLSKNKIVAESCSISTANHTANISSHSSEIDDGSRSEYKHDKIMKSAQSFLTVNRDKSVLESPMEENSDLSSSPNKKAVISAPIAAFHVENVSLHSFENGGSIGERKDSNTMNSLFTENSNETLPKFTAKRKRKRKHNKSRKKQMKIDNLSSKYSQYKTDDGREYANNSLTESHKSVVISDDEDDTSVIHSKVIGSSLLENQIEMYHSPLFGRQEVNINNSLSSSSSLVNGDLFPSAISSGPWTDSPEKINLFQNLLKLEKRPFVKTYSCSRFNRKEIKRKCTISEENAHNFYFLKKSKCSSPAKQSPKNTDPQLPVNEANNILAYFSENEKNIHSDNTCSENNLAKEDMMLNKDGCDSILEKTPVENAGQETTFETAGFVGMKPRKKNNRYVQSIGNILNSMRKCPKLGSSLEPVENIGNLPPGIPAENDFNISEISPVSKDDILKTNILNDIKNLKSGCKIISSNNNEDLNEHFFRATVGDDNSFTKLSPCTKKQNEDAAEKTQVKLPTEKVKIEEFHNDGKGKIKYESFPVLRALPQIGDIIAVKLLSMDENMTPTYSNYQPAKVFSVDGLSLKLQFLDDNNGTNTSTKNDLNKLCVLDWRDIKFPRLMFP